LDESISQVKEATAPFRKSSAFYHITSSEFQYHTSCPKDGGDVKQLTQQFYPARFSGNAVANHQVSNEQSTEESKTEYLYHEEIRKEASTVGLYLQKGLTNGAHKMERSEKPGYHVVFEPREKGPKRLSVTARPYGRDQIESAKRVRSEIYDDYQKELSLFHGKKCLSNKEVVCLKPSGYQTNSTRFPATNVGDHNRLAHETHSLHVEQLSTKYPGAFRQYPRAPNSAEEHHSSSSASQVLVPVASQAFVEANTSEVHPLFKAANPDSIQPYPGGNVNPPRQKQEQGGQLAAQSVTHCRSSVTAHSGCSAEVPFLSHSPHGNSHPVRYMASDCPSVQCHEPTLKAFNGVHSFKTTLPSVDHYYPENCHLLSKRLQQMNANLSQYHKSARTSHCVSPKHILAASPVRHPEVPIDERSQKSTFPVRPIPPDDRSYPSAPCFIHYGDVTGRTRSTELSHLASSIESLPIETDSGLHYSGFPLDTNGYKKDPPSYVPSQVKVSQSVTTNPTHYNCQPAPEGRCCPVIGSPDVIYSDSHSPRLRHPKTSAFPTTISHPDYPVVSISQHSERPSQTTSGPHFGPINGLVPPKSFTTYNSETPAFPSRAYHQKPVNRPDGTNALVNIDLQVVTKRPSYQRSGDNNISRGPPCANNNIVGRAPGFFRVENSIPAIETQDECQSLETMKEPRCYISVDSKPQVEEEKEQSKLPQEMGRLPEKTEARFPEVSSPSNSSSPDDKLSKLVTFVVGLETEIHWNKCKPKKDRKNSCESENEMQIVNISSTQRSDDPSTETPSDSSGSDSEDSLGMIRLERVYYSASPHVKSPNRMSIVLTCPPHLTVCSMRVLLILKAGRFPLPLHFLKKAFHRAPS